MCAKQAGNRRVVKTQSSSKKKGSTTATAAKKSKTDATPRVGSAATSKARKSPEAMPFTRKNYMLLLVGVAMIIVGFLLMSVDDFVDATKFSISLYIAPVIVVGGFVEIIFAIMYQEKKT